MSDKTVSVNGHRRQKSVVVNSISVNVKRRQKPSRIELCSILRWFLSRIAAVDGMAWDLATWVFPVSLPHNG